MLLYVRWIRIYKSTEGKDSTPIWGTIPASCGWTKKIRVEHHSDRLSRPRIELDSAEYKSQSVNDSHTIEMLHYIRSANILWYNRRIICMYTYVIFVFRAQVHKYMSNMNNLLSPKHSTVLHCTHILCEMCERISEKQTTRILPCCYRRP